MSWGCRSVSEVYALLAFSLKVVTDGSHLAARSKSVIRIARLRSLARVMAAIIKLMIGRAERMKEHLEAPSLLQEPTFEQVRGPDRAAVVD